MLGRKRGVEKVQQLVVRRRLRDVVLIKKPLVVLFLVIFVVLVVIVLGNFFSEVFENFSKNPTCGDGSFYNTCSLTRPYYCEEGVLVKRPSICGCPEGFVKREDICFSNYQKNPKSVSFDYVLRGSKENIGYIVYEDVVNYLSGLSRTIFYTGNEVPSRVDFKLKLIDEEVQRQFLLPLVIEIQNRANNKEDQMRIAVSLVQNIPFKASNKTLEFNGDYSINYSRYPYEVLYEQEGICGERSELLAFLLREIGYGVVVFYHNLENHESVGVKCPAKFSLDRSEYCFVETSGPSILGDNGLEYVGGVKLESDPEIMLISNGLSLKNDLYEYEDAKNFEKMRGIIKKGGRLDDEKYDLYNRLKEKYGISDIYQI